MRFARVLLTAVLSLSVLGCPPDQRLTFYNDSGQTLTVLLEKRTVNWGDGGVLVVTRFSREGSIRLDEFPRATDDEGRTRPVFRFEAADGEQREFISPATPTPDGYFEIRGENRFWYQVGRDLILYLVPANPQFPLDADQLRATGLPSELIR